MYFLRGGLPWQGLKAATNKQKYEKIGEKKQSTPIKELCEGFPGALAGTPHNFSSACLTLKRVAEEFSIYLNYVRKLGFEETPDYDFLRELFTKVLKNTGEPEDGVYDWMLLNNGKGWEASSVSPSGSFLIASRSAANKDSASRQSTSNLLVQAQHGPYEGRHHRSSGHPREGRDRDRERERAERHALRASQAAAAGGVAGVANGLGTGASGSGVVPPSPALVRHGSKSGDGRTARKSGGMPGGLPSSTAAQQGVPPPDGSTMGAKRQSSQSQLRQQQQHPYASSPSPYDQAARRASGYGATAADEYRAANSPVILGAGTAGGQGVGPGVGANGGVGVGNGQYMDGEHGARKGIGAKVLAFLTCRCG